MSYQIRKEAEAQARRLRNDVSRPAEERQAILDALGAETEQSVSAALGPQAFKACQKYDDRWLSHLVDGLRLAPISPPEGETEFPSKQ